MSWMLSYLENILNIPSSIVVSGISNVIEHSVLSLQVAREIKGLCTIMRAVWNDQRQDHITSRIFVPRHNSKSQTENVSRTAWELEFARTHAVRETISRIFHSNELDNAPRRWTYQAFSHRWVNENILIIFKYTLNNDFHKSQTNDLQIPSTLLTKSL